MANAKTAQPSSALRSLFLFVALLMGLAMIGSAWWISRPPATTDDQTPAMQEAEKSRQTDEIRQRREQLSKQIQFLVDTEEAANRVAILRARSSLDDAFVSFSDRVPRFADEVTTFTARYNIAVNGIKDKFSGTHDLERLASDYFEKHVASNGDISSAIDKIVAQFYSDLTANRNRMLSETAVRIREADLGFPSPSYSTGALDSRIVDMRERTVISLGKLPAVTTLSISGSVIVEFAIQAMFTRAVSFAAGATTTGAAAGTGAGTATTPGVGTVIGFFVGAAAGMAVDYILTEKMKAKIILETRETLNLMKGDIWNSNVGLYGKLDLLVKETKDLHTAALVSIAKEGN